MRAVVVMLLLAGSTAGADDDKSTAQHLFEEGLAELEAGHFDIACTKFADSLRKNPRAVGTLLNLARCNEKRGRVATALALFQDALDRATEANLPNQKKEAAARVQELSPQVPIVTIAFTTPTPNTKLVIDDSVVAITTRELPIDPGHHEVVMSAPGRVSYVTSFDIKIAERHALVLPALELPKTRTIVRERRTGMRRVAKIVTLGGGVVTTTAVVMAGVAKHRYDLQFAGATPACGGARGTSATGHPICSDAGQARVESSRKLAGAATIVGGIGLAAVATGVVLWVTSRADDAHPPIAPQVTPTSVGLVVTRTF